MPNIAVMFRQETIRLASREIRNQTRVLRKASAQFRRDIAELKRQSARLKSDLARMQRQLSKESAPQAAETETVSGRYSAKSVIAQRKRLALSAANYAKLVGVTAQTIFNWEHGASRPRQAQIGALVAVRKMGKREASARLEQMNAPKKKRARRR